MSDVPQHLREMSQQELYQFLLDNPPFSEGEVYDVAQIARMDDDRYRLYGYDNRGLRQTLAYLQRRDVPLTTGVVRCEQNGVKFAAYLDVTSVSTFDFADPYGEGWYQRSGETMYGARGSLSLLPPVWEEWDAESQPDINF